MTKQRNPYLDLISPESLSQSLENLLREYSKFAGIYDLSAKKFRSEEIKRNKLYMACDELDRQLGLDEHSVLKTVKTLYVALLQNHMLSDDTQRTYRPTDD